MTLDKKIKWVMIACIIGFLFLCVLNRSACAANHYISPVGDNTTGEDWTHAWTDMPLASGQYDSALVRGDTYFYADGTNYHTYFISDSKISGSLPNFVNIKKATIADHGTETGWNDSLGNGQAIFATFTLGYGFYIQSSCINFDGQNGSGADTTSTYGFKINMPSTTNNRYCFYIGSNADSVFIDQCDLDKNGFISAYSGGGVYVVGSASNYCNNIKITNCFIHNCPTTGIFCQYMKGSTIANNYITRINYRTNTSHGQPIAISYCGRDANNSLYYNIISNSMGTTYITIKDTEQSNFKVYGNLFFCDAGFCHDSLYVSNGVVGGTSDDRADSIFVYNNTIYNIKLETSGTPIFYFSPGDSNQAYNNLIYGMGTNGGIAGFDYHDYNACNTSLSESNDILLSSDPFVILGSNFHINETWGVTLGTGKGYAVGSPYNVDMEGNTNTGIGVFGTYYENPPTPPEAVRPSISNPVRARR